MIRDRVDRRRALEAGQIALGILALGWVVTQPDWATIRAGLAQLTAPAVVAILALSVLGVVAKFVMWTALLRRGVTTGLWDAGRIELSVNFVNQLLPSRLSGRVAAPFVVRRYAGIDWERAVAVSIAHTGLFACLYGVFATLGLLAGLTRFSYGVSVILLLSTGLYIVAGVVILGTASSLDGATGRWLSVATRLPGMARIRSALSDRMLDFPIEVSAVAPLVRSHVVDPRALLSFSTAWVVALAVVPGLRLWLLFEGMGASVSPVWALPLFAIAAYSVTLLPLTPGGIGVTEATATLVFVAVGVPSAVAVPAVLIDRFAGVYLPALCGWYPTMSLGLDELRQAEVDGAIGGNGGDAASGAEDGYTTGDEP